MDKTYTFTVHQGEDYISIDLPNGDYKELATPVGNLVIAQLKALEKFISLAN